MRYAEFYTALRDHTAMPKNPRVLVFGCSTGLELQTVQTFWPAAEIFGCDIEQEVLDQAANNAPGSTVFMSTDEVIREHGPFDLVCANSVLCRNPFPDGDYTEALPFTLFERFVNLLVDVLRPNGYLMAYNTNYFIQDLDIAMDLAPINVSTSWNNSFIPRVSSDGQLVALPVRVEKKLLSYRVTEKLASLDRMTAAIFSKQQGRARTITVSTPIDAALLQGSSRGVSISEDVPRDMFAASFTKIAHDSHDVMTTILRNPLQQQWETYGTWAITKA